MIFYSIQCLLCYCYVLVYQLHSATPRNDLISYQWLSTEVFMVFMGLDVACGYTAVRSFVRSIVLTLCHIIIIIIISMNLSLFSLRLSHCRYYYHTTYRNRIKYFSFSYISLFCSVSYLSIVASVVKRIIWKWEMIFHDILWNEWSLLCCILHKTYYWEWGVKMSIKSK